MRIVTWEMVHNCATLVGMLNPPMRLVIWVMVHDWCTHITSFFGITKTFVLLRSANCHAWVVESTIRVGFCKWMVLEVKDIFSWCQPVGFETSRWQMESRQRRTQIQPVYHVYVQNVAQKMYITCFLFWLHSAGNVNYDLDNFNVLPRWIYHRRMRRNFVRREVWHIKNGGIPSLIISGIPLTWWNICFGVFLAWGIWYPPADYTRNVF